MFCKKCGNKVSDRASFCTSCGAEIIRADSCQVQTPATEENVWQDMTDQRSKKKKTVIAAGIIVAIVIVIIIFALIGGSNPVDTVKNGNLDVYPEKTVGDAFDDFFDDPRWFSYKSNGNTYVKFTGSCTLYDEPVKAKIIFLIDGNEFRIDTCKIGEISVTSKSEMEEVLDVIYE